MAMAMGLWLHNSGASSSTTRKNFRDVLKSRYFPMNFLIVCSIASATITDLISLLLSNIHSAAN